MLGGFGRRRSEAQRRRPIPHPGRSELPPGPGEHARRLGQHEVGGDTLVVAANDVSQVAEDVLAPPRADANRARVAVTKQTAGRHGEHSARVAGHRPPELGISTTVATPDDTAWL